MLSIEELSLDSHMLDEVRSYLRIDEATTDNSLNIIMLAAISHAEKFTGQILLRRTATQIITAGSGWQNMKAFPVFQYNAAYGLPAEGAAFPMPEGSWQSQIDADGNGHIRIRRAGTAGRVNISYESGIYNSWNQLPEALRLAILRLAGYLYSHRDSDSDKGPPASVAALLQPWRRIRISMDGHHAE